MAALDDFLRGAFETDLGEDELVTDIELPAAPPGQVYEKFEQPASHLPLAGVCAVLDIADGVIKGARIAVTGVAGRVFRARAAEVALPGTRRRTRCWTRRPAWSATAFPGRSRTSTPAERSGCTSPKC